MDISLDLGLTEQDVPKTSDDYYTPKWVFDQLGLEFDTDPAQPIGGCQWIPVKRYFTILDDGLSQEWTGRVWCNPPYSKPGAWVHKFIQHGNGVMLINLAKSKWFDELWAKADAMTLLPYNMKFVTPSGAELGIFMPTALFAMGSECAEALENGFNRVR